MLGFLPICQDNFEYELSDFVIYKTENLMISCKKSLTEALNRNESRTDLLEKRTRDLCVGHQRTGKHSSRAFSCFSIYSYMKEKCGKKRKTLSHLWPTYVFCPHNPLW